MAYSKAQHAASERYNDSNYFRLQIRIPAGRRDLVEELAANDNVSVNRYVNDLLAASAGMNYDTWTDPDHTKYATRQRDLVTFAGPPDALDKLTGLANLYNTSIDNLICMAILQCTGVDRDFWAKPLKRDDAAELQNNNDQPVTE